VQYHGKPHGFCFYRDIRAENADRSRVYERACPCVHEPEKQRGDYYRESITVFSERIEHDIPAYKFLDERGRYYKRDKIYDRADNSLREIILGVGNGYLFYMKKMF